MKNIITGKAFVLGDDIDTDQIIPAEYLVYRVDDPEERKNYGKFCLTSVPPAVSGLPDGNIPFVREGEYSSDYTIVIGGKNFGCGSSREHAPIALAEAGAEAVVAQSYARIFFRNCVNGGYLPPFETPVKLNDTIKTGDELEIDVSKGTLTNKTQGTTHELSSLGDVEGILRAGDVFAYAKEVGMM